MIIMYKVGVNNVLGKHMHVLVLVLKYNNMTRHVFVLALERISITCT